MPKDPPVPEPLALNEPEITSEETLHFDYPGSDIVLRSCDYQNFNVPKLYIVNSSPVLRELIESVSNTSDIPNGERPVPLPVVKLQESGAILHSLLTLIFPVVSVLPSTSEKIMELLAVAQKYQMDSVLSDIRSIIGARKDPPFIRPETALHIYFLAQEHELHPEVIQSARVALRLPMVIEDLGDKLDFPGVMGAYLHELWKYHERVRADLKSGVPEFKNSGLPQDVKVLRCIGSVHSDSPPRWLDGYIDSIADAPHLFDLVAFENARARHSKEFVAYYGRTCSCLDLSDQLRRAFWEALTAFVHETVEKVRGASVAGLHRDEKSQLIRTLTGRCGSGSRER